MENNNEIQQNQPIYADATIDTCFKQLLSNLDVAKDIITSITGLEITEIVSSHTPLPPLKMKNEPQPIMDFHVITESGEDIIIEMQNNRHLFFDERAVFYLAGTFFSQNTRWEKSPKIKWYHKLKKAIAIQFLDYDSQAQRGIQVDEEITKLTGITRDTFITRVQNNPMKEDEYIKDYVLTDKRSGQMIDIIELIQVELPRADRILNLSPDNAQNFQENEKSNIKWWLSLLSYTQEYTREAVVAAPDIIQKGFEMLEYSKWNAELRSQYLVELKTKNQDRSQIDSMSKELLMKDKEISSFEKEIIKLQFNMYDINDKMKFSKKLKKIYEEDKKGFDKKLHESLFGKKIQETLSEAAKKKRMEKINEFSLKVQNIKFEDYDEDSDD